MNCKPDWAVKISAFDIILLLFFTLDLEWGGLCYK